MGGGRGYSHPYGILPLNRMSFSDRNYATEYYNCGENYATGYHVEGQFCDGYCILLAKFLCDTFEVFYATGYRVWRDLLHIPVTSLVKYPPGLVRVNLTRGC